jgi:hypothetical protein
VREKVKVKIKAEITQKATKAQRWSGDIPLFFL